MTTIVAYDDGKTVFMGSDSCGICAGMKMEYGPKLIRRSNYHIGFEGSYRVADIIKEAKLPKEINSIKDIRTLRDIIREEVIDKAGASCADCNIEENNSHPVSILIISKLGIHEIQSDYAILKATDGFSSLGAGRDFAIGCLATHHLYSSDAETAVRETIKIVKKYCTDCGGKVYTAKIERN